MKDMDVQREAAALRFRKGERLRLRTLVEQLFAKGDSLFEWPLRAVARPLGADALGAMFKGHVPAGTGRHQMHVTEPKRRRRHAVDRVLMRRRIREAWRLNRAGLRAAVGSAGEVRTFSVAFIYLADKNVGYPKVEQSMKRLLAKMEKRYFPDDAERQD